MKGVQTTVLYDDKDTWVHWGSFVDIKNIPETYVQVLYCIYYNFSTSLQIEKLLLRS